MKKIFSLISFVMIVSHASANISHIKPIAYLDIYNGKWIYNKIITIEDGKIKKISDSLKNHTINQLNLYLVPGFFDCHSHILFTQTIEDSNFHNALLREANLSNQLRIDRAKKFLNQYLTNGFTSICDLGNSGYFLDYQLRKQIKSQSNFPDLYISGPGIAWDLGQFNVGTEKKIAEKEYSIIDEKTNLNHLLLKYKKMNVDILKLYIDNSPGHGIMPENVIQKIFFLAKKHAFRKITIHAFTPEAVAISNRLKLEHVEHYNSFPNSQLLFLSKSHFITPTELSPKILKEFNYYNEHMSKFQIFRLNQLKKLSLKLVFGPDFYFHKEQNNFNRADYLNQSISFLLENKFSNLEVLRMLTLNPAQSLKLEKRTGNICIGCLAHLIGFKEDILKKWNPIKGPDFVMINGRIHLSK